MRAKVIAGVVACTLLVGLAGGALEAWAYRAPLIQDGGSKSEESWLPPSQVAAVPGGQIEGACGVAIVSTTATLYVSDYYHRVIDAFSLAGLFKGSQVLAGGDPRTEINELDAVCGLAADAAGNLYGNELDQAVLGLPDEEIVDAGHATGVAVDEAGNVYVNDRTYVAVYDAPVEPGEAPAEKIGLGSLGDAYGVAVDSKAGRVYVPDAAANTVKVFEPAIKLPDPVAEIDGPAGSDFSSLRGAAVAVDTSEGTGEGHLLVIDDSDSGAEEPGAAIYEFDSSGNYLDRLQSRIYGGFGEKHIGPLFGEPSGLAVDPDSGDLYVTTGNSAKSNLLKYGPFEPFAPPLAAPPASSGV
ncbi:MAG TPA: hypothetical protein VMR96_03365, partial [Solirubrobacterales bacterium]|nr:hypothetical protein [Solirubrobacterales bacterium]